MLYSIDDCKLVKLPKDLNSNLTCLKNKTLLPFNAKRIYYLYGVPENNNRGGHAHKNLFQLVIAASGSFNMELNDGKNKKDFFLNNPAKGLLIVPGLWRNLIDFSFGTVCLVIASEYYTEDDYIRNYDDFLKYRQENV